MPNTVRLHRVLATRPEKVYRAFIEPDAMAKWLPPNGMLARTPCACANIPATSKIERPSSRARGID